MHDARSTGPADPDPNPEEQLASPERVAEAICDDLLSIHRDSYGRAAEGASATFIDNSLIVLMEGVHLLPNEQFLVDQGKAEAVAKVRHEYQLAIEPTFRAAVERASGRRVIGFASLSQIEHEPRFSVEIFRLEPT